MIGKKALLVAAVVGFGLAASAQASVIFGFEGTTPLSGWTTWNANASLASSTAGVTEGTQSMAYTAYAWTAAQGNIPSAAWSDIYASKQIIVDFTIPSTPQEYTWGAFGGYWGDFKVGIQGTGITQTFSANLIGDRLSGLHTVTFDLSAMTLPASSSDAQLLIQTNWGGSATSTYTMNIDNIRTGAVPEPATLGVVALAGGALTLRRRRAHA